MKGPMPGPKSLLRCAIYTRKSSDEGLEQDFNSLHAQREACAAFILSQTGEGWTALSEVYDDGGFSGGNLERPALQRLLADVGAGKVDIVVVYKVDRLTRSLADFARIVDVLDGAGASFVSVTQAFNTTTSMGRLTLNVLLSFAQFEREVTGERIRDKLAASKAKGLWMGGTLPLGYDPDGRTLAINGAEAALVRRIFARYLELGSVEALRAELAAEGVRSKEWRAKNGNLRGGAPFGRGALFYTLSNRLYLGEIPHKGTFHPGQHPAIIDAETFERVQATLAKGAGPKRRQRSGLPPLAPNAPLTGLIFDDAGGRMSPVTCRKGSGFLYRYYVSSKAQKGRATEAGSIARAPAPQVEAQVLNLSHRMGLAPIEEADPWPTIRPAIRKVVVSRSRLAVTFHRPALEAGGGPLEARLAALGSEADIALEGDTLTVTVRATLSRRGNAKLMVGPAGAPAHHERSVDQPLLRALAQGEAWKRRLLSGKAATIAEIATTERFSASLIERSLRLAFLAPDLKLAILEGRAPRGLMLERLKSTGVPDDWREQQRVFAR